MVRPGSDDGLMVTARLPVLAPAVFAAVSVTVKLPEEENVWVGFRAVLVPPSPNVHDHAAGEPEDVSVNWTTWPTVGELGE
jgi:hypothetical protein